MKTLRCLIIGLLLSSSVLAQETLQIIKSNSKTVSIRNGQEYSDNSWTIIPEAKPDIYFCSELGETVTFITDVDSVSVVIKEDTSFDFIILLNETDSAFTQITYQEPYLNVLKKAKLYDKNQSRDIPLFSYLNSENENLIKIRKDFNLDSVAGKGNEISQLLNIMHWVHNKVQHDGSSSNPKLKNALDLVKVCAIENRGINCRMMATILNECYLSMGFKSRMVTCMPRPLEFQDCHVINTVFSKQLEKWIWLDPTFDAYIMDEKGQLLGIQEVREKLINDEPLILNPEANWNRQISQTKENYLDEYMAKNLYRLSVPVKSTFNSETKKENKTIEYIQLLPLDGINQEPNIEIFESSKTNMTYKTYIINNPKQFWKKNNY